MKKLIILFFTLFNGVTAYCAYRQNVPVNLQQPDGSIIHCFITGDEFHRRVHDKDNYTIIQDPTTGYYVYAIKEGEELKPSLNIVEKSDPKMLGIEPNVDIPVQLRGVQRDNALKSATIGTVPHTKGKFHNLVVFVRFADDEEYTDKLESYNTRFNDHTTGANSVYNYFKDVSYGQLEVVSSLCSFSSVGNVLSYRDTHPRNYYSPFSVTNPTGYTSNDRFEREHSLLRNILAMVSDGFDSNIPLDGNNDGIIDNICFILKGDTDGWADILWPHASSLEGLNITFNNKKAAKYNVQLSQDVIPIYYFDDASQVSVLCHELFHSMGAPDLYRYNDRYSGPVHIWDLMGHSIQNPTQLLAYMRYKYGKWINDIPEINKEGVYYLRPISSKTNNCFKLKSPNSATEYFILEYRNVPYDYGIVEGSASRGLLIYRINTLKEGWGNMDGPPDEVYVYRPYGSLLNNGSIDQATFNENEARTTFNDTSNPSCFLSQGQLGLINISEIGLLGDSISFKVNMAPQKNIFLDYPKNAMIFTVGDTLTTCWRSVNVEKVNIEYTLDGNNWSFIDKDVPSSATQPNSYRWIIPNRLTNFCKLRISNAANNSQSESSAEPFSIVSEKPAFVSVLSPNGNEVLEPGNQQIIRWKSYKVSNVNIWYSINHGLSWKPLKESIPAAINQYSWTVPNILTDGCRLRIIDAGSELIYDDSNESFAIIPPVSPSITLTAPLGNEGYETGTYQQISWKSQKSRILKIEYSINGGDTWTLITDHGEAGKGFYGWKIPDTPSAKCKIRISDVENPEVKQLNELDFSIVPKKKRSYWEKTNDFYGAPVHTMILNKRKELISSCYRSTDAGETWQKMKMQVEVKSFKTVIMNPADGYLYALSPESANGIFQSTNNGDYWSKIPMDSYLVTLAINDKGELFCIDYNGEIRKSTDNGQSWTHISKLTLMWGATCMTIKNSNELYVGSYRDGIYISHDGGMTWKTYFSLLGNSGPKMIQSIVIDQDGIVYAGGGMFQGIAISRDSGTSWEIFNNGFECPSSCIESLFLDDSGTLYAGLWRYGMYKSMNKGKSWISMQGPNVQNINSIMLDKDENLFLGTSNGVKKLSYSDATWMNKSRGITGDQVNCLLNDKGNNQFIGTASDILFSPDEGRNWEPRNALQNHMDILSLFETEKGTIISGVNWNPTFRTLDKGKTWEQTVMNYDIHSYLRSFKEDTINKSIYCVTNEGVLRSKDEGMNWEIIYHNNENSQPQCLAINPERRVMVLGSIRGSGLMVSKDFGNTFDPVPGFSGSVVNDLQTDKDGMLFAALGIWTNHPKAGLYKSSDDGKNWEFCGPPTDDKNVCQILFTKSKKTIIIVQQQGVWVSYNKGLTWSQLEAISPDERIDHLSIDQNNYLMASTDRGSFYSANHPIMENSEVGIPAIESSVLKIYPNPTNGRVTIECIQPMDKNAVITVSTMLGDDIFRKELTNEAKIQLDLSNQVNGIYLLRMDRTNKTYINKIVLKK